MKQMTDAEYIHHEGAYCPFCHGDQIEGDSIETDGKTAWQEVSCNDCDKSWTDLYELTGYNETS